MPTLPNRESAIVEIDKLAAYCLDPSHVEGKHKARVFESALGLKQVNAEWLKQEILNNLENVQAIEGKISQYGKRYIVDMKISYNKREATLRTAWIILNGELAPRMTTCYLL